MVELEIPNFLIQLFNQKYLNVADPMIRWKWSDGITKFLFNRQSICGIWNYMLKYDFPLVYDAPGAPEMYIPGNYLHFMFNV